MTANLKLVKTITSISPIMLAMCPRPTSIVLENEKQHEKCIKI